MSGTARSLCTPPSSTTDGLARTRTATPPSTGSTRSSRPRSSTPTCKPADVQPLVAAANPVVLKDVFADYLTYLRHSNSLVEQTYQLDKQGAFTESGTPAGKAFVDRQLAAGAIELRDMIYTAWIKSAEPVPAYWEISDREGPCSDRPLESRSRNWFCLPAPAGPGPH